MWGGGVPLRTVEGVWERGTALFPEIFFSNFGVKMAYFRGLVVLNFVFNDQNSIKIQLEYKDCRGD